MYNNDEINTRKGLKGHESWIWFFDSLICVHNIPNAPILLSDLIKFLLKYSYTWYTATPKQFFYFDFYVLYKTSSFFVTYIPAPTFDKKWIKMSLIFFIFR